MALILAVVHGPVASCVVAIAILVPVVGAVWPLCSSPLAKVDKSVDNTDSHDDERFEESW